MPALYAHLRFGNEVLNGLPKSFQALTTEYSEAFALGTQGPDILFYHKPMKKNEIRLYGTKLHEKNGFWVFDSARKHRTNESSAYNAYLLGFLCHFTLDLFCHPYIDQTMHDSLSHGKIESEFDKFLLRKDGKPIRGYNTATPIIDKNGTSEASALLLGVPQDNIAKAIKTMRKINGWFSKKGELFHSIAHTFLKIAKMERKFGDMFLHKKDNPLCLETNAVLEKKFTEAIPVAKKFIIHYFDTPINEALNKEIFDGCFRYDFSGNLQTEV